MISIGDAERVETGEHPVEEGARGVVQAFAEDRCVLQDRPVARILAVEDAQRIALEPSAAVLGQPLAAGLEVVDQPLAVGAPALGVAQRVQLEGHLGAKAQRLEDAPADRDHLDVGLGLGRAQHLDVDLVELAQPALLRPLVAEHRAAHEQADRQALAERARDQRPRDPGRELGPERDPLAAPILEGVHLLGDDVRGLAERAREHLGELEHRRRDLGIAVARRDLAAGLDDLAMAQRIVADDVVGAADGAKRAHADTSMYWTNAGGHVSSRGTGAERLDHGAKRSRVNSRSSWFAWRRTRPKSRSRGPPERGSGVIARLP